MTRIDIFSGFLGAGKTTLIKKLIKEAYQGEQLVLIENEFGEIGIDGGFLKESGIRINEMNSGCICCSLVGDFGAALKQVIHEYHPDRILIEPSGVGKLSDVIRAVQNAAEHEAVLGSAVCVADATKVKLYMKNFGEFYNNQIETAACIILSRTGGMNEEKLAKAVELIRGKNDKATLVTTAWDELTGAQLLAAMENTETLAEELKKLAEEAEHEHHHHHDDDDDDEDEHEHHHHHHDDDDDDHECCHHHHDDDEHEHHHEHHYDENGVCSCGHHHHGHDADEVFTSWGRETAHKYDEAELKSILEKLAVEEDNPFGIILRAKGIIPDKEGKWLEFDLVPGEFEVREGSPDYTGKLCVIGSKLQEKQIAELFGITE